MKTTSGCSLNDTLVWKNAHTSAAPAAFTRTRSLDAQALGKLPALDVCIPFFFRLADCHLVLLCAFLPPLSPGLSLPEALFDAFPWNLSLPELISQPLSVFQVSVSHLHHARLDLSPQPAGGSGVSAAWNQALLFSRVYYISQLKMGKYIFFGNLFFTLHGIFLIWNSIYRSSSSSSSLAVYSGRDPERFKCWKFIKKTTMARLYEGPATAWRRICTNGVLIANCSKQMRLLLQQNGGGSKLVHGQYVVTTARSKQRSSCSPFKVASWMIFFSPV